MEDKQAKQADAFEEEQNQCLGLFQEKNSQYDGAFFEDDLVGAYHDLKRKWVRIEALLGKGTVPQVTGGKAEALVENLRDMANYSNMTTIKILGKEGCSEHK